MCWVRSNFEVITNLVPLVGVSISKNKALSPIVLGTMIMFLQCENSLNNCFDVFIVPMKGFG